jgi:hypothetical protein
MRHPPPRSGRRPPQRDAIVYCPGAARLLPAPTPEIRWTRRRKQADSCPPRLYIAHANTYVYALRRIMKPWNSPLCPWQARCPSTSAFEFVSRQKLGPLSGVIRMAKPVDSDVETGWWEKVRTLEAAAKSTDRAKPCIAPSEFGAPLQVHPRPRGRRRFLSWGSADLQRPLRAHVSRYRFRDPALASPFGSLRGIPVTRFRRGSRVSSFGLSWPCAPFRV